MKRGPVTTVTTRWAMRLAAVLVVVAMLGSAAGLPVARAATQEGTPGASGQAYADPEGRFSAPIPTGWTLEAGEGYGALTDPDGRVAVYALAVAADDPVAGIDAAWRVVDPAFALEPADSGEGIPYEGTEANVSVVYDDGSASGEVVAGFGWLFAGTVYAALLRGEVVAAQERGSQIDQILTGFDIAAIQRVDLSGETPAAFAGDLVAAFEAFVGEALAANAVPGASIAVVQNGQTVYSRGFGVRELGGTDPMTPQTRMLIGSTTKSTTTMLLATLVDDGVIAWDTPVTDVLPDFRVADPELTARLTVRDLVCNCTGIPRRDLELIFNAAELTPEGVVAQLAGTEAFTPYGEAFQYSNQMVAAGGLAAGAATGGQPGALQDAYIAAHRARVLEPIGMTGSTFSFDEVAAAGDYATPHGFDLRTGYRPDELATEEVFLGPVAASGGLWSTAEDMARYALTELGGGIAPDGTRVVSAENLGVTWTPQVPVTSSISYGLGWFVEDYKGVPVIQHGGNTLGFTSDFAFLPENGLGIVVLANAQASNAFNVGVRQHLFDLVYGQAGGDEATPTAAEATPAGSPAPGTPAASPGATPVASPAALDTAALAPYVGTFANEALGTATVAVGDGVLTMDIGEFTLELVPDPEGDGTAFVVANPPLASVPVALATADDGSPILVVGEGVTEYAFAPAAGAAGGTPAAAGSPAEAATPVTGTPAARRPAA